MKVIHKNLYNIAFWAVAALLALSFVFLMMQAMVKVSANAVENKDNKELCILIDPGHGGEDGGAVSPDGVVEKEINIAISNYLKELYVMSGYEVRMTRSGDTALGDSSLSTVKDRNRSDMNARLEMYNSKDIDCVISIHQNKFTEPQSSGAQVFYSVNDEKSEILAESLRKAIIGFLQPDNTRELKAAGSNIYLLNNCQNPCVLVECGFLSNPEETSLLINEEYQRQMAFSIYCGTLEYFKSI